MNKELDLLLINPGAHELVYGELNFISSREPPLWCALIAGFIREKGYTVKIMDADVENLSPKKTANKIVEYDPLLACIIVLGSNPSVSSTPKMTAAGEILRDLKKLKDSICTERIKTILGGLHPSALPIRTLTEEDVDFVCQGEGFHTILRLLESLKDKQKIEKEKIEKEKMKIYDINGLWYIDNNKIVSNPSINMIKNIDELPFAAWDLLSMDVYRAHNWHCFSDINNRGHYGIIYTSLGCPFNCTYCNIHALYNGKPGIRFRSPEKVVDEIDLLVNNYKIKNLKIFDELFTLKEEHVVHICDLIIKRGYDLNIWAYARVDKINEKMLKKMKQAGINWLAYGLESASRKVRVGVAKKFNQEKIKEAVNMTHDAGIYVIGNFIFGLPDDNFDTIQETLNVAKELNLEYVNFHAAIAYPGSKLYDNAIKKNIKLPEMWHDYSQYGERTLPLPTKYLSATDVLKFRDNAFREYFSNPTYLKMIEDKFGIIVVNHIKDMLKYKIRKNM